MYTENGRKYLGVYYNVYSGATYRACIMYKSRYIFIGEFQLACDAAAHVDKVLDIARESRRIRNFQTRKEYHKERYAEIISRANEYYDSFTDEQKKIVSKDDLKRKLLEISKDNRKPVAYLVSKLLGEDCVSYTKTTTTFIGSYLDKKFGRYFWTPAEISKLMQLVKQHGTKAWKKIASEMKTKSMKQCYTKHLNETKKLQSSKSEWTPAEISKLMQLVMEQRGRKDWKKIASEIKTKSKTQCVIKYHSEKRKLGRRKKGIKAKNRWTDAEIAKLERLVKKHGTNWKKIAQEIGTKNRDACQAKFNHMNKVTPNKQKMKMRSVQKSWTDAEIAKLERLHKKHGTNWKKIAQELSRTKASVMSKVHYMENSK